MEDEGYLQREMRFNAVISGIGHFICPATFPESVFNDGLGI